MRTRLLAAALAALCLAPPAWADQDRKPDPKTVLVPYHLTTFNHVMVRAKINGKGPFNFILDTGAPALFVATKAAKKAGVDPDKAGWGAFDKFVIEGGVPVAKARDRISRFNGEKVEDGAGLLKLAAALTAGNEVKLTVIRGEKQQDVTVKAGEGL